MLLSHIDLDEILSRMKSEKKLNSLMFSSFYFISKCDNTYVLYAPICLMCKMYNLSNSVDTVFSFNNRKNAY